MIQQVKQVVDMEDHWKIFFSDFDGMSNRRFIRVMKKDMPSPPIEGNMLKYYRDGDVWFKTIGTSVNVSVTVQGVKS